MDHSTTVDAATKTSFFTLDPNRKKISSDWRKLLWVFIFMSIAGLIGETLQHYIVFNVWEHRGGLVWGPFSPIYGTAGVLLLLVLEPLLDKPAPLIILVGCFVGGGLEYFASWAMETFWGVVAWSYASWPLNFNGRTDITHSIIWGLIGFIFIKVGVPLFDHVFERFDTNGFNFKIVTNVLAAFLALDIFFTCTSLIRANERTVDIPQNDYIDVINDTYLTDDYLRSIFNNMGGLGMP